VTAMTGSGLLRLISQPRTVKSYFRKRWKESWGTRTRTSTGGATGISRLIKWAFYKKTKQRGRGLTTAIMHLLVASAAPIRGIGGRQKAGSRGFAAPSSKKHIESARAVKEGPRKVPAFKRKYLSEQAERDGKVDVSEARAFFERRRRVFARRAGAWRQPGGGRGGHVLPLWLAPTIVSGREGSPDLSDNGPEIGVLFYKNTLPSISASGQTGASR